ncbi:MAG: hypothetical protein ACE14V_06945 [bacterium]
MSNIKHFEERNKTEIRILNKIRILSQTINNLSKSSRTAVLEPTPSTKMTQTEQPGELSKISLTGEEGVILTYCSDRK